MTTSGSASGRPGIEIHRRTALEAFEMAERAGIPCTSVARTLLDLAAAETTATLERAFAQAEFEGLLNLADVRRLLELRPHRQGRRKLLTLADDPDDQGGHPREELEKRFRQLCRANHLPPAELNVPLTTPDFDEITVDCMWRSPRLIVELDSRRAHATRSAFERDRHRDAQLTIAGWRVVRFTWRQITQRPDEVAQTLRALLNQ